MARNLWTREETIVAFNVYCKIPFKNSSSRHPMIIKFANIIGRSPSALNMKIGNFGRLDPELRKRGIVGLGNGSRLEKTIWDEFHGNWEKLAYESELLIAQFQNKAVNKSSEVDLSNIPVGIERETVVKRRVNQQFFRSTVLSSYQHKCCITGLSIPKLLIASHIIPWSQNKAERLNPRNGLCLNAIHDKAFDQGLLTISPDYKVILSPILLENQDEVATENFFIRYANQSIALPEKFTPHPDFLAYHYTHIFKR